MLKIKVNDKVAVISGKDKGKMGKVLRVFPLKNRVVVESVNVVKKAKRKTQQEQQGGIAEVEAAIHVSNLMLVDKKTNKPTRITMKVLKDGSKVRISKKSGEVI